MKNTATATQIEAVANIASLAASTYDSARCATKRMNAAMSQIACLNHQEVRDYEISQALCDIHHCAVVRAERIERRAKEILKNTSTEQKLSYGKVIAVRES